MRTASLVLGIVGGVLAIIFSFAAFATAAAVDIINPYNYMDEFSNDYMEEFDDMMEGYSDEFSFDYDGGDYTFDYDVDLGDYASGAINGLATYMYVAGALGLVGAVMGIVGGALAKKKNVVAGILMIVACVLAGLSGWGIFASICLLIGGILALVKDKSAQAAYPYPYSGYQQPQQQPPYNPYQQPQQPQQQPPYNPYQQPQQPPYNPYQQPQQQQPYNPYQQQQQPPQAPPAPPAPPQEPEAPKTEE